jgi:hypothetical protein
VANTISNIGGQWNLIMRRGADFIVPSIGFENADGSPINLTGCTFAAEMRTAGLAAAVAAQFTITPTNLAGGIIGMSMAASITAALACGETIYDPASLYVWDMKMTDAAGKISTPLWGNVNVMRQVQHA